MADKLKIKGLCERGTLIPEGPPLHNTITTAIPVKEEKKQQQQNPTAGILSHSSFDNLLSGRTTYLNEQPVTLGGQTLSGMRQQQHNTIVSSAPPAHQSPKNTPSRGTTRPPEQYMIISSPKKAKYSLGSAGGHPSILRNQLVTTKDLGGVEVKSEPMILSSSHHQEDVPSSVGSVSVTEFITSEVLTSLVANLMYI